MKRLKLFLMVLSFSIFAGYAVGWMGTDSVYAAPGANSVNVLQNCSTNSVGTDYCKEAKGVGTANPAIAIIKTIIDIISIVAGAAAVIGLIISGLRIVLANGDSNAVASARSGIIYSLIGIIVIVFAQLIVIFVLDRIK